MLEELIQKKIKAIEVKVTEYETLISEIEKEKQFLQMLQKKKSKMQGK